MKVRHPSDLLRTFRRSAGLTQSEVTRLMGFRSRGYLSRIECGKRTPVLEQALRYEFLFGVPFTEIAPGLCSRALNGLWEDIQEELTLCEQLSDPRSRQKYEMLSAAKERIEALGA